MCIKLNRFEHETLYHDPRSSSTRLVHACKSALIPSALGWRSLGPSEPGPRSEVFRLEHVLVPVPGNQGRAQDTRKEGTRRSPPREFEPRVLHPCFEVAADGRYHAQFLRDIIIWRGRVTGLKGGISISIGAGPTILESKAEDGAIDHVWPYRGHHVG